MYVMFISEDEDILVGIFNDLNKALELMNKDQTDYALYGSLPLNQDIRSRIERTRVRTKPIEWKIRVVGTRGKDYASDALSGMKMDYATLMAFIRELKASYREWSDCYTFVDPKTQDRYEAVCCKWEIVHDGPEVS